MGTLTQVNINMAGKEELEVILGLGPDMAEDIINYREVNGPFRSWDDLKNIEGITDSMIDELRNRGITL